MLLGYQVGLFALLLFRLELVGFSQPLRCSMSQVLHVKGLELVGVELVNTEIFAFDFPCFLLQELWYHVVHGFLTLVTG